jgi:hypothetical protein
MPPQPGDFAPGWSDFLLPIASSPAVYGLGPSLRACEDRSRCSTPELGRNPTRSMKSLGGSVTGLGNHPTVLTAHSLDIVSSTRSSSPPTASVTFAQTPTRPLGSDIPSRRDFRSQRLYCTTGGSALTEDHRFTGDVSGCYLPSSTLPCTRADTTPRLARSLDRLPASSKTPTSIHPKDLLDPRTILVPLNPATPSSLAKNHKLTGATTSNYTSVPARVHIGHEEQEAQEDIRLSYSTPPDAFDVSTSHPASIVSVDWYSHCDHDRADVSIVHPASKLFLGTTTFSTIPIDPPIVHPASVHTMSLQPSAPPSHVGCKTPASHPINLSAVHPASISSTSRRDFGPSESRYIHPASSAFRTFDSATTHPASVCSGGQSLPLAAQGSTSRPPAQRSRPELMDNGDARVSHPGWGGFGLAKPQRPRL